MILWFWSGHNWVTSKGHLYSVVFVFIGKKKDFKGFPFKE